MSLMRLLTAGKTLVGLKEQTVRYRMSDPRALPKFGPAKNPFRAESNGAAISPAATDVSPAFVGPTANCPAGRQDARSMPAPQPIAPVPPAPSPSTAPKAFGAVNSGVVANSSEPFAVAASSHQPPAPHGTQDLSVRQGTHLSARSAHAHAASPRRFSPPKRGSTELSRDIHSSTWAGTWATRLISLVPRPRAKSRPTASARSLISIQAELSLDQVKVVRNDLSDTDLEIVTLKRPAPPVGAEPASRSVDKTRSVARAGGRVAIRFFSAVT